jgi:hypothetical protein
MAENNSPGVKLIIKGCSFERQFGKPVVWESTRRAVIKSSGELSCTNLVVVYLVRGVSKSITPRSQSFITHMQTPACSFGYGQAPPKSISHISTRLAQLSRVEARSSLLPR